jgi:hypothetical protein
MPKGFVLGSFRLSKIVTKENVRGLVIALAITALLFLIGGAPE